MSSRFRTKGYWSYDSETKSLVNRWSKQQFRFEGPHDPDGHGFLWPGRILWRFTYRDPQLEYPLIVSCEAGREPPTCRWIIDHVASVQLWRLNGSAVAVPPYGVWRRIDASALDAMLCWPESEVTGLVASRVEARGGWSNGRWRSDLHRWAHPGEDSGFETADGLTESVFLEALNAEPPRWRFIDVAEMASDADLAGVREIAPDLYFLPHDSPLTGFEQRMPHLLRDDGRAVIFPAGYRLEGRGGISDGDNTWFLYADDDVFFFFAGCNGLRSWHLRLTGPGFPCGIGLRREGRIDPHQPGGLPAKLFVQRQIRDWFQRTYRRHFLTMTPSPPLVQRVTAALFDAGFAWQRTGEVWEVPERIAEKTQWRVGRMREDGERMSKAKMEPANAISVEGGYVGGQFNTTYRIMAYRPQD